MTQAAEVLNIPPIEQFLCMTTLKARGILVAACMLVTAGQAHAGAIYNNEAAFLAALDSSYTEDYTSLPVGGLAGIRTFSGNGFSYDIGRVAIVATGAFVVKSSGPAHDPNALQEVSPGAVDLMFGSFSGVGVDAIGGYFYNAIGGGSYFGGSIQLGASDGLFTSVFSPFGGIPTFFGYVAAPGTKLTSFRVHSPTVFATADRVTVGNVAQGTQVVPEPGTLALIGIGVAAAVIVIRRRQQR